MAEEEVLGGEVAYACIEVISESVVPGFGFAGAGHSNSRNFHFEAVPEGSDGAVYMSSSL